MFSDTEPHPLEPIFHPRSVAVVGVSEKSGGMGGGAFVDSLLGMGFPRERLYPVHPRGGEFRGLTVYASLREIPGPVDYVISSIPAAAVPMLVDEAIAKDVKAIHFFTAGFSETGEEEREELEREVLEKLTAAGIRVIGPNCMGLYVPQSGLSFMRDLPTEPGHVAMVSQSGANAGGFVRYAGARGVRFSKVISYGNGAQLTESDFFEYLATDADTRAVFAYIEGVRDGRRFLRAVRACAERVPVVILKGGRGEAGARAARSHTGSLAGSLQVFDAACRQAGALRVEELDELVDLAVAVQFEARPAGRGVAVVGMGGGTSVLAADEVDAAGLDLPVMPQEIQDELHTFTPLAGTSVRNPIDSTALFQADGFLRTFELAARPESVHTILFHVSFGWGPAIRPEDYVQRIADTAANLRDARSRVGGKPILVAVDSPVTAEGAAHTIDAIQRVSADGFPTFVGIPRAARTIAELARLQALRRRQD